MKVLNLYAGIEGNRKLWEDCEVTAVEYDRATAEVYQDYFPEDKVILADAHQYLLDHYKEFDFIWSSPPCPTHSDMKRLWMQKGNQQLVYPDMKLYQEIIMLQTFSSDNQRWVVENVKSYYAPLINPTKELCRHYFWCNFKIGSFNQKEKPVIKNITGGQTVFGFNIKGTPINDKRKALRNMVDPELGNHIYQAAKGIYQRQNKEQGVLEL